jgi:hypothetical protein
MDLDRPVLFGTALAAARALAEYWRKAMWSHVYEQMLSTGKSSHEATVETQALMHKLTKAAPHRRAGRPRPARVATPDVGKGRVGAPTRLSA